MKSRDTSYKGRLVARVLSGSWRSSGFPQLEITKSELDTITPLLYDSGAAALAWHRLSQTSLRNSGSAELLHHAYRLQSLQSDIQEQKIEKVFRLCREAQLEAILAKGWATAGIYSTRALRPFGDIDICVPPEQFKLAEEVFSAPEANDCWVDLHQQFSEIGDRTVAELLARSTTVALGAEQIRILGLEDQLALSSIHLLKHGAWRPLWLCDVGVAIESLPQTFSWNTCLGQNATRAKWIMCAMGLAKELLDADTAHLPENVDTQVPTWLIQNVLKQWERPFASNQPPMSHPMPMANVLRHPSQLPEGLRQRWPNPILATISVNGEFNNLPRLPYQLANCVSRVGRLLFNSPKAWEH
jgi:hypothetical protein